MKKKTTMLKKVTRMKKQEYLRYSQIRFQFAMHLLRLQVYF